MAVERLGRGLSVATPEANTCDNRELESDSVSTCHRFDHFFRFHITDCVLVILPLPRQCRIVSTALRSGFQRVLPNSIQILCEFLSCTSTSTARCENTPHTRAPARCGCCMHACISARKNVPQFLTRQGQHPPFQKNRAVPHLPSHSTLCLTSLRDPVLPHPKRERLSVLNNVGERGHRRQCQ